jgi:hypothetical protein
VTGRTMRNMPQYPAHRSSPQRLVRLRGQPQVLKWNIQHHPPYHSPSIGMYQNTITSNQPLLKTSEQKVSLSSSISFDNGMCRSFQITHAAHTIHITPSARRCHAYDQGGGSEKPPRLRTCIICQMIRAYFRVYTRIFRQRRL